MSNTADFVVCSACFRDEGLRLDAYSIGADDGSKCPNCRSTNGRKLTADHLENLAHRFFVWGSLARCEYGAAPVIQFNEHQETSVRMPDWLRDDVLLIERALGIGFFHYGPRLWMIGEVEPLKDLQDPNRASAIIVRILGEYPGRILPPSDIFYRIRKAPELPENADEYDSPPISVAGDGRLDSPGSPVMYASSDLQVCIHECRVTAEDDVYVATLSSVKTLRLLDLTALLTHEETTEFESLDMAVHMLFLAGTHSYSIARTVSEAVRDAGFDGVVYPSYFSLLRLGAMPFRTVYGISTRRFPSQQSYEQATAIPNMALFGRPIEASKVEVRCINRLILRQVEYGVHFGPVGYS